MNNKKLLILAIFFILFTSCGISISEKDSQNKPIAKSFGNYLYKTEFKSDAFYETVKTTTDTMIYNWAVEQMMQYYAKKELSDITDLIDKQVENYRKSLYLKMLEKHILKISKPPEITKKQIFNYYHHRKKKYILSQNIVKMLFVKILLTKKNTNTIEKLKIEINNNPENITNICKNNNWECYNSMKKWIYLAELIKKTPFTKHDEHIFLRKNKIIEKNDSKYYYLIYINNLKLKGDTIPLQLLQKSIEEKMRENKNAEIIQTYKKIQYKQAINDKNIIYYYKNK